MANFCLMIQYDGTRYHGWQRQGNTSNTIQEKLETILEQLYGEPVDLNGSGRTDAGVHALRQIANFRIPRIMSRYSCQKIQDYFNQYLPQDIRVLAVEQVPERFHARLSASSKLYEYRIDCGEVANVFQRRYLLRVEDKLNLEHMREAADLLTGTHDFKSFCQTGAQVESTVRTIYSVEVEEQGENDLVIRVCGNGFLYNMVRIIAGTLIQVGKGKFNPEYVKEMLDAKDRTQAGQTAPPQGLTLMRIEYL